MYVHIPGGVDETPVEMTISASPGDAVKVRVANGRAWVTGNQTAPPTDDTEAILAKLKALQAEKRAITATESAEQAAQAAAEATTSAGIAGRAASIAQAAAEAAQATADSKKVVFTSQPTPPYHVGDLWVDGGSMTQTMSDGTNDLITSGAELLEALILGSDSVSVKYCIFARTDGESFSEDDWSLAATDDTVVNELREWFWHDSLGAHILGDTTGYRNDLDSTGMHIVDTSTETEIARFGADGAQIGPDDKVHTVTDANGIRYYGLKYNQGVPSGTKMIANIGCTENQGLPYFVFGSTFNNPAFGDYSMTEGYANEATGDCAHAEGEAVRAKGRASHAGGDHTIAGSKHQMAIGRYNIEDTNEDYSFIIGNGKVSHGVIIRANALTVDWSGNVVIAGGLTANADSEVNGSISATGDISADGDATITGDLSANSVTTGSDIDWTELTLDSACVAYSSVTTPHYKRRGDMVTVIGDVKPSAAVAAQGTLTIGTLPAMCCPPQRISLLCQGSTTASWLMQIATDGTITASRYRTEAGYQAMNTNTWLPFSITYMV